MGTPEAATSGVVEAIRVAGGAGYLDGPTS